MSKINCIEVKIQRVHDKKNKTKLKNKQITYNPELSTFNIRDAFFLTNVYLFKYSCVYSVSDCISIIWYHICNTL